MAGRVDLLSVIAHEMGHAAGLDHDAGGTMADKLDPGVRSLPAVAAAAAAEVKAPNIVLPVSPSLMSAMWSVAPGAVPTGATPVPVFDWSALGRQAEQPAQRQSSGRVAASTSGAATWQLDFVNHLGRTEKQRDPNAALRLQVDLSPRVSVKLSTMQAA